MSSAEKISCNTTCIIQELHWLPVEAYIKIKTLCTLVWRIQTFVCVSTFSLLSWHIIPAYSYFIPSCYFIHLSISTNISLKLPTKGFGESA